MYPTQVVPCDAGATTSLLWLVAAAVATKYLWRTHFGIPFSSCRCCCLPLLNHHRTLTKRQVRTQTSILIVVPKMATDVTTQVLPLELIDKAIGSQIWVLMRGSKEVTGTLLGFDDYVRHIVARCVIREICRFLLSYASILSLCATGQSGTRKCRRILTRSQ